jgi:hypothetical protein
VASILLLLAGSPCAQTVFVIEAEDFNHGSGQHVARASTMPYSGGAYAGLSATHNVDYYRGDFDNSSDEYRRNEVPNVPMNQGQDIDRGSWTMTSNYKLGWIGDGNWCNYTRVFPTNTYRVYAAISHGDGGANLCRGSLQRVTGGANTTSQTVVPIGTFSAPGTGGWGDNVLVPMRDASGSAILLPLGGLTTLRFTTGSGDFDYLRFVQAGPPEISEQPQDMSVVENRVATFGVVPSGEDPVSYQWQRNRVNIPGATGASYTFVAPLGENGSTFRCVLENPLGNVESREAILTVTRDQDPPQLVQAVNLGSNTIRVTFDEGMRAPAGAAAAHFVLDGGILVYAVGPGNASHEMLLSVSALNFGVEYTLTVSQVADLADQPNFIAPESRIRFVASEYAPADIGDPVVPGETRRTVDGGFEVSGSGQMGGANDQFHFGWAQRTGDFDIQARLVGTTVTDPFLRAGLMARESLETHARFGAVFASSAQLGCFFEARMAAGASPVRVSPTGGFPLNHPATWLRLRRAGSTLTGFASFDGRSWVSLGSRSLSGLGETLYFGLAVASGLSDEMVHARFVDVSSTLSSEVSTPLVGREPLGPSSRATGLIFSEIMYHPRPRVDGRNLEFIEIYNAGSVFAELTGWRLTGSIDYVFPDGFILPAGGFVVVAAAPQDLRAAYGGLDMENPNVLGPYSGSLPNSSGTVQLRNNGNAIRLDLTYSDQPPWSVAADGAGHSLVLARPSLGEADPQAWMASERIGGSPGTVDALYPTPLSSVLINEFLAHTDEPQLDFIELYNRSNEAVDISGCWLSDRPAQHKFRIPDGTVIPARGFVAFDQNELDFALSSAGETLYLFDPDRTRLLDAIRFGGQENGVSTGRWPDGAPTFRRLGSLTPAAANGGWRQEEIVINEIMYNPISGDDDDEYLELYNRSEDDIDLAGWRLVEGVQFTFPPNTRVPAGGYLVVSRNEARLRARYPQLNTANMVGNYSGRLSNSGERVALAKPDTVLGTDAQGQQINQLIFIVVGEVTYRDGGRWGQWSDGGGSSLELIDPHADPLQAANWADSDETQKAEWTSFSFTGVLDHGDGGHPPNRLRLSLLGPGECLVDDVEIQRAGGANLVSNGGFESGNTGWSITGNHRRSVVTTTGPAVGARSLHIRGQGKGDTGVNGIRTALPSGLNAGDTATIGAKVRWLAGWPELLVRTRGNWIEFPIRMALPDNLGSPGLRNSRYVANAGPAIYDVRHDPPLPRGMQPVRVTCRVSDADGIQSVTLRYRLDPSATLLSLVMRDEGTGGDEWAGDGVYSAVLTGRSPGTLVAFHIEAMDGATAPASAMFPAGVPEQECLVRWGDPEPFGNFPHYYLWSTSATEAARNAVTALDNTWRDATLVYGNHRVIYNTKFRDKGSPYHGGAGDFAVTVPPDDLLLGVDDRVFASTGNADSEATAIRSQLASWLGRQLEVPYLHAQYMQLFRNGTRHRNVTEDLEQPNRAHAERWFPNDDRGDLYKVSVWFEFQDNNTSFGATGATLGRFVTAGGGWKLARYRWNFERRSYDGMASNYGNLFDLVEAAHHQGPEYPGRLAATADVEQWMRSYIYSFIMGNWDVWSYAIGQNMYLFKPSGQRWVLMPWDIDFTFGLGDGPTTRLWGGQDATINRMYDTPVFRRMVWRTYLDAVHGPLLPERFQPQIDARRTLLQQNLVAGVSDPEPIRGYINQRRSYLLNQIAANDVGALLITTNNGNDFSTPSPIATLNGTAPFAIATLEVNGIAYPVTWLDQNRWRVAVPLPERSNVLVVTGKDRRGNPIPGAVHSITVTYTGAIARPEDHLVINEIMYHPAVSNAEFVEIHNTSTTHTFDLTGCRLAGIDFDFPAGTLIAPGGFVVVAKSRAAFSAAYGASIPVVGEYPGRLQHGGERLRLLRRGATGESDIVYSEVTYGSSAPWPTSPNGLGPSLQLMDPMQDNARVGNWASAAAVDPGLQPHTPGAPNSVRMALPEFPPVWLNEIQPVNLTGTPDNQGEREPWLEIYVAGIDGVDLAGFHLSDSYTNLRRWAFPSASVIEPGQYRVVWLDGQTAQSTPAHWHSGFRLNPVATSLVLSREVNGRDIILDHLDFGTVVADRSFGRYPDGDPESLHVFFHATPAAPNSLSTPPIQVWINEWMASNSTTVADPADGQFDDWFELYNAGTASVNLGGYTLTDKLSNPGLFVIPQGVTIPSGGFLLVWADDQVAQNGFNADLHVNFKLSAEGEAIGLFAPDGSVVDVVLFGPQSPDVSQGRYPDGASGPFHFLEPATPRAPNLLPGGPPRFDLSAVRVDADGSLWLTWHAEAGRRYLVQYKEDLEEAAWNDLGEVVANGPYASLTDRPDPAVLRRFYRLLILE